MDPRIIGASIKKARTREGYTQQELAALLGITDKAVSKWERGLGIPDISLIAKLSEYLNEDSDNLLAGNVFYQGAEWMGVLRLPRMDSCEVPPDEDMGGASVAERAISPFLLAGIRDILVVGEKALLERARNAIGLGEGYGVSIRYEESAKPADFPNRPALLVEGYSFLYGANITRYIQRAFSKNFGVTVLAAFRKAKNSGQVCGEPFGRGAGGNSVLTESMYSKSNISVYARCLRSDLVDRLNSNKAIPPDDCHIVPMGRGVIYFPICDSDSLEDAKVMIRAIEKTTGIRFCDLREIAEVRGLKAHSHPE